MGVPDMDPETSAMASALQRVPLSRSLATYAAHCASTVSKLAALTNLHEEGHRTMVVSETSLRATS